MVVAPEGHHVAVVLHVRREKRRLALLQDVQRRHLRGRQTIVFHIRAHRPEFAEVVERGRLGVAEVSDAAGCIAGVQPKTVAARLREIVKKNIRLHPLDLLRLLLSPWAVLVVGVVLKVLDPQPLCLFHEGALVTSTERFPRLACEVQKTKTGMKLGRLNKSAEG